MYLTHSAPNKNMHTYNMKKQKEISTTLPTLSRADVRKNPIHMRCHLDIMELGI